MSCFKAEASGKSNGGDERPSITRASIWLDGTGSLPSQVDEVTTEKDELLRKYFLNVKELDMVILGSKFSGLDDVADEQLGSSNYSHEHKEETQEVISEILDVECGEPIMSQYLRIDFNPLEGVDDSEFLLEKCMNFWKLVEGSKTLQDLKGLPEENTVVDDSVKSSKSTEDNYYLYGDFPPPRLGAIEVIEEHGLGPLYYLHLKKAVDNCFVSKIPRRYCDEGSGDYFAGLPPSKLGLMTNWASPHKSDRSKLPTRAQREELSKMCRDLEKWDSNHPKSMEPPNHGPPHTYAVMQRNH